eukprot:sb/3466859/
MLFLGIRDKPIPGGANSGTLTDNQLGGLPTWPLPSQTHPPCSLCDTPSWLVAQINAPLVHSTRVLYLFSCVEEGCQNKTEAWTALRGIGVERSVVQEKKKEVVIDNGGDWGVGDDWGVGGDTWGGYDVTSQTDDVTVAMETLSITESYPGEPSNNSSWFKPYYLYVEPERDVSVSKHHTAVEEEGEGAGGGGGEKYEKTDVKDREFYKFYKRLSLCPEQCLRYDVGGKPLLLPSTNIPRCDLCHGPRQFELQLMPALISILRPFSGPRRSLDYRTVGVYTCANDCSVTGKLAREVVICVPEPEVVIPDNRTKLLASKGS